MNKYRMFMIETLTNMHVGSGDTHFGVVDNLIQRNPVTKAPVIHASGIKGAILDCFKSDTDLDIKMLFGGENQENGEIDINADETKGKLVFAPGRLIFFEANMLTIPLRANRNVYYDCTSVEVVRDYLTQYCTFKPEDKSETEELKNWFGALRIAANDFIYFNGSAGLEIEDCDKGLYIELDNELWNKYEPLIKKYLKTSIARLAIFNDTMFTRICESAIPVIARNKIDKDGISENLFYEEALPRKTQLYFLLGADKYIVDNGEADKFFTKFKNKEIYQFGANYSIGYGFSRISEIA